jgi:predicted DNA-binding transcriptional regulator AlpA
MSGIGMEMSDMSTNPVKRFWTRPSLAARYDKSPRSIDRWIAAGRFPKPDIRLPNGQPAWADSTIERHERASVANV